MTIFECDIIAKIKDMDDDDIFSLYYATEKENIEHACEAELIRRDALNFDPELDLNI